MLPSSFMHAVLGKVHIRINPRAKRFIMRVVNTELAVTVPPYVTLKQLSTMLDEQVESLRGLIAKQKVHDVASVSLYPGLEMQLSGFSFEIDQHEQVRGFLVEKRGARLRFLLPQAADTTDLDLRQTMAQHLIRHARQVAPHYLPTRLRYWANQLGLSVGNITITHGKKRLGACNQQGDIQLSYYLTLMPPELSDYVILHELAHLTEMNHSPRFHALLDRYAQGRSKALQQQLKAYRYPF